MHSFLKLHARPLVVLMLVFGSSAALGNVPAAAASPSAQVSVLAAGFDSPRGVAISDGHLLVAESGHGGDVCISGTYGPNCIGTSSQISVVDARTGAHHPLVSGLFSSIFGAVGPIGVEGISVHHDRVLAILGLNSRLFNLIDCSTQPPDCPAVRDAALAESGQLISVSENGRWRPVAPVGAFDFDNIGHHLAENPEQKDESNPFGVLATQHGAFVANAAAGTLDFVSPGGNISLVHYFQFHPPAGSFPSDEVPTCIVQAHGHIWMGDLDGHLFRLDGSAPTQIPVVDRSGSPLLQHVSGCATAQDDDDGAIYLVNLWQNDLFPSANTGSVVRYNIESGSASVVVDGLNSPNMLAVGEHRTLYVSANSVCPATGGSLDTCGFMGHTSGELLKVTLPQEDH
jgi:hypothetical protein